MVLNLSPLASHLNESLTSLRFATKVGAKIIIVVEWKLKYSHLGQQYNAGNGQKAVPVELRHFCIFVAV